MPGLSAPDAPLTDGVVTLRGWRTSDVDAVVDALQDPEISRWTSVPSPYGPREFDAWLDEQARQRSAGVGVHLLVVDGQDHLLGAVGVQWTEEAPDIGYWCVAEHRGRGHTTRAVRLLNSHLREVGCPRVDIFAHHENSRSQRVAEAAGFRRQPGLITVSRLGTDRTFIRFTSGAPAVSRS